MKERWIPVTEALPDHGVLVCVRRKRFGIDLAMRQINGWVAMKGWVQFDIAKTAGRSGHPLVERAGRKTVV